MAGFLKKLFFGKLEHNLKAEKPVLSNQWTYLMGVWENDRHNDAGLERLLRLFLIAIQFIFPGIYIRHFFSPHGLTYKNLAIEVYIISKGIYPIVIFSLGQTHQPIFLFLAIYLLLETLLYIAALVFVSDIFSHTRSFNRAILLLLLNYIEITFQFALIYSGFKLLNSHAKTNIDFLYYSFVTSASLGYGDIYPSSDSGKLVVCAQSFIFIVFIVLFINYFSGRKNNNINA